MKAERERREAILRAEGEKKSTILVQRDRKSRQSLTSGEAGCNPAGQRRRRKG